MSLTLAQIIKRRSMATPRTSRSSAAAQSFHRPDHPGGGAERLKLAQ